MINAKKRTAATIFFMSLFAVVVLSVYFYLSNRTEPFSSNQKATEVQKLADKDLEHYYPGTSREVVKLFAGMMKTLYNNPNDDNIKILALKLRSLYDNEFLANNTQETYLTDINKDLSKWKKDKRKIVNYLLLEREQNQESEIDGVKYATQYITFTVQEASRSKFTETWNVLLRLDTNNRWKILGWEQVTKKVSK